MRALATHLIHFRSPTGDLLGHVALTPARDPESVASAPLIQIEESEAATHGETPIQLREGERYEYEVQSLSDSDLRLRCHLATRRKSLHSTGRPDAGLIETCSFCGTLLLELVDGEVDPIKPPIAIALLDVRSLKLNYRTQYRGMLRRLAEELAGLVADARSSSKASFRSSFEERSDAGWLQVQLELLRETVDGADFSAALRRILSFPHERLSTAIQSLHTDRSIRWTPAVIRQLVTRNPRRTVPPEHSLRNCTNLETIAEQVFVAHKSRDLDTPENRFVRSALRDFRSFLTHAQGVFESTKGWQSSAALTHRLTSTIDDWLGRGLFRELGELSFVPLSSPVLQRKAGYREVLRWWLRFRTAAELSWEGGEDLFHVGQRDVATLYEYWLFFELLDWFCQRCGGGNRPPLEQLLEGLDDGSPSLRLKKRTQLGPFMGAFGGMGRRLNARFAYNRRFEVTTERRYGGSWTRRLHPDYTLTFWPDGLTEEEAEQHELLVHVHFDAKYRVEDIEGLFGDEGADDSDDEVAGNYKRQDLLKMHAYRDAIKRSQGAYVLYPGGSNPVTFKGFHEILPGLGAFSVAPDESGNAIGMDQIGIFLDGILAHLSNRTTAQERLSYHVGEVYRLEEQPVAYGAMVLPETDEIFGNEYRALPPAEEMVLIAWYQNEAQLALARAKDGFVFVRLGQRRGALHVHPNLAKVRRIMLRTHGNIVASGFLVLREVGFHIFTRSQLRSELEKHAGKRGVAAWQTSAQDNDDEFIYALFRTREDPSSLGRTWRGDILMDQIENFESDARNKPFGSVGRTSPFPRILPLRDVLKALA